MDDEIGKTNQPPKLGSIDLYPGWKDRFGDYLKLTDYKMWIYLTEGYTKVTTTIADRLVVLKYDQLSDDQKKILSVSNAPCLYSKCVFQMRSDIRLENTKPLNLCGMLLLRDMEGMHKQGRI